MIQAWAMEQGEDSRHQFAGQDVMVPWRLQKRFFMPGQGSQKDAQTHDTQTEVAAAGNAAADATTTDTVSGKSEMSSTSPGLGPNPAGISYEGECQHVVEEDGQLVFQRYCHVYKEGELEDLCRRYCKNQNQDNQCTLHPCCCTDVAPLLCIQ
jgi:hypothetical protein